MGSRKASPETSRDQPLLSMEEALALLLAQARPISDIERIPTMSGRGRVLAETQPQPAA